MPARPAETGTAAERHATGQVQDQPPALRRLETTGIRRRPRARWWHHLLGPVVILAVWLLASYLFGVSRDRLPAPHDVLAQGYAWIADGTLLSALADSGSRAMLGLLLGGGLGLVFGFLAAASRIGEDMIDPLAQAIRTVPTPGLVGLFIIWFGIGDEAKIALVAAGTFFPIYLHVYAGIRLTDATLLEAARSLGYGRTRAVIAVGLPSALPHILVGLRQSLAISWLILIIAEQINASDGIGWLMTRALEVYRLDQLFVALLTYAALGAAIYALVTRLERFLVWRDTAG